MNEIFILGVIIGCGLGGGYVALRRAALDRIETVDRAPRRRLPGVCCNCGETGLDANLHCVTCGSDAVWTPPNDLPKVPTYEAVAKTLDEIADADGETEAEVEAKRQERHRELAAKMRARFGRVDVDARGVS